MKRLMIVPAVAAVALFFGVGGLAVVAHSGSATAAETTVVAQEHTVTFAVENMTCAACPITVRTAMRGVDGVRSVDVDFDAKSATVTFDPAVTTAEEIGSRSANAGYPAQLLAE